MKICLISPDYWNYDHFIVKNLQNKGIEAYHIKYGRIKYGYPTFLHRTINFFRKLFLGKNIKRKYRQEYVLEQLEELGKQDKVLAINPEMLDHETHLNIKEKTDEYLCYLYDSIERNPATHLLNEVFDRIYSFDESDCSKYGLIPLTNYIYLEKTEKVKSEYTVFSISSIDERLRLLNQIAHELDRMKITYKFIIVGKKRPKNLNKNIEMKERRLSLEEVEDLQKKADVILDLIRPHQKGLSFRIFEAMALQKKIITSNSVIKNQVFYNPNNILIINPKNPVLRLGFFKSPYQEIPKEIYDSYTLDSWTRKIFNLK